jgi:small conductance mechanosensitive channel
VSRPGKGALSRPAAIDQISATDLKRLVISLGALVATLVISRFISHRIRVGLERGGFQANIAILLARVFWIGVWVVAGLFVLSVNGIALTALAAVIGVLGLALSLSLQQVLQNLVAGIYLLAERPFQIGDTVSVVGPAGLNHEGTVEDIQMRTTHLRSRDDELILVPNSAIFAGVVTNLTAVGGHATQVTLTFPRDAEPQAMQERVVLLLADLPAVLHTPKPELHMDRAGKDSWTATLTFWAARREARSDAIWALAHALPEATVNDGEAAS